MSNIINRSLILTTIKYINKSSKDLHTLCPKMQLKPDVEDGKITELTLKIQEIIVG